MGNISTKQHQKGTLHGTEEQFMNIAPKTLNFNWHISSELKGYQIMYGRGVTLAVWCAPGVNLEKFCRTESIQVTRGVWTKNIRPSGRKDVVVTVSGLV